MPPPEFVSGTNGVVWLQVLIVPPGWFAQWFSVSETLGTMTPVLNEHNYDIVLSEILKVRDQVGQSSLLEHVQFVS